VKEVKRDRILITFDGWGHSSQCWYSFTSRDIFPAGWCKKSGHILQYPGDIVEKKAPNASINQSRSKLSTEQNPTLLMSPPVAVVAKPTAPDPIVSSRDG